MLNVNFRAPENLLIFGKSGDSGRPNNDGVVGHRDPLVEREVEAGTTSLNSSEAFTKH